MEYILVSIYPDDFITHYFVSRNNRPQVMWVYSDE